MRRLWRLVALVAAGAVLLVACEEQDPVVSEEEQVPEDIAEQAEGDGDGGNGGEGGDGGAEASAELVAVDIAYEDVPSSITGGVVEFVLDNQGNIEHDIVIEELGNGEVVPRTPGGETGSGTAELEPGTYTLYCSVAGHREAGMEAQIEVE